MAENRLFQIEERLRNVPRGKLLLQKHTPCCDPLFPSEEAVSSPDGKGMVESWNVFPGIVLAHSMYRADRCRFRHAPSGSAMQINYCRSGRAGWTIRDGAHLYLGPGDLSLHMMDVCAESVLNLPLGYYEGVAILADLDTLEREPPDILREAGFHVETLRQKFCGAQGYTAMPAGPQLSRVCSELYAPPAHWQLPYFQLKVQELLLFLSMLEPEKEKRLEQYSSRQIEIIQTIHQQLTEHLERRSTIEELSKQYLINTSSLKAIFKSVYGAPIATYMKEYRIREAAGLLRKTGDSIAEVAAQVGYENQSKFTAAFKGIMGMLPTAYRRQHQKATQEGLGPSHEGSPE